MSLVDSPDYVSKAKYDAVVNENNSLKGQITFFSNRYDNFNLFDLFLLLFFF
jgi:hypothetical protein